MKNVLNLLLALTLAACGRPQPFPTIDVTSAPTVVATPTPPSAASASAPAVAIPTVTPAARVRESPTLDVTAPTILPLSPGEPLTITQIHMLDVTNGWAIGRAGGELIEHVFKTSDGGATWTDVTPNQPLPVDASIGQPAAPFFMTADVAWVTYNYPLAIWHTEDGGVTWMSNRPLSLPTQHRYHDVHHLHFVDDDTGWLLAHVDAGITRDYVAVYGTTDGGLTWDKLIDPNTDGGLSMNCHKYGLAFADAARGWVFGSCGTGSDGVYLYRTADGGRAWAVSELTAPAEKPTLFDPKVGYASGIHQLEMFSSADGRLAVRWVEFGSDAYTSTGWLYTTRDGGLSWAANPLPGTYNRFHALRPSFINLAEGWVMSDGDSQGGLLHHTLDGGARWTLVSQLDWIGQPEFVDAQTGWVVAQLCSEVDCATGRAALMTTQDGGRTWQELHPVVAP